MSQVCSSGSDEAGVRRGGLDIADGLGLAAGPTFLLMALATGVLGGGAADMLCAPVHASPLSGMVPMYLLMAAFHAGPWLRLAAGRRKT